MKILLMDKILEQSNLDLNKRYEVIRTHVQRDDSYYVVINENGEEVGVHELLAREVMHLGQLESLLSVTSSFSSHFADCISMDDDVEVDEDFLEKMEQFIEAIESLQIQEGKEYQEILNDLKSLYERCQESYKEGFGCYEADYEDNQILSHTHGVILEHCEEQWEKRRKEVTGE